MPQFRFTRPSLSLLLLVSAALASVACHGKDKEAVTADGDGGEAAATEPQEAVALQPVVDGGDARPMVIALSSPAPVFTASEWPPKDALKATEDRKGVTRLGYLRKGARVPLKAGPIKKSNCPDGGWYELATGGFICGKYATTDPQHKELKNAPHDAWLDRPLPYDYGLNLTPGTPLYRRIPLRKERAEHERTLAVGKGAKPSDVAKKLRAQGEEVPAYLKTEGDAKPSLGFNDLKGETSLVAERMLRGFYVSLDTKVSGFSGTFWRTVSGMVTPKDHLLVHETKPEYEGIQLAAPGETRVLPLAFVIGTKAKRWRFAETKDGKKSRKGDPIPRYEVISVTGKKERVDDHWFYEATEGYWLRDDHVAVVSMPQVLPGVGPTEKWIDVDITAQSLVAFEGEKPVFATIVSTGRHNTDPAKDHTTVQGTFKVREKHVTDTMDDDAAADGTYRIEDVPWVMYFEKSYALHGAFWHSSFGRERSHGCVNLMPIDARWIFHWVGPTLPEGWHGVAANDANPGSKIVVHK